MYDGSPRNVVLFRETSLISPQTDAREREDADEDDDDDNADDDECDCFCRGGFGSKRSARVEKEWNGEVVQWVDDDDDDTTDG